MPGCDVCRDGQGGNLSDGGLVCGESSVELMSTGGG